MAIPLNVLILEDRPADAELLLHELRRAGFDPTWRQVQTEPDYLAHLDPTLDIILADYTLPQFNAMRALQLLQKRELDIPFLVVTGSISEEVAVECMKQGAADYLLKDRLTRLGPAIRQALEQKQAYREKQQAEEALRKSEELFRQVITSISPLIYVTEVTEDGQRLNRYLSPNIESLTGYPYEKFIADWSFWPSVVIHPEDRAAAAEQAERLVKGQDSKTEYRLVRADDEVIWVRDSGRTKAQGSARMIYGVVSDITESKQAQEENARLYAETERRAQQLAVMHELDRAISASLHIEEVYQAFSQYTELLLSYDRMSIVLLEKDKLHVTYVAGLAEPGVGTKFSPKNTASEIVIAHRKPLLIQDVTTDTTYEGGAVWGTGIQSVMVLPLHVKGEAIGTWNIGSQQVGFYDMDDLHIAQMIADQLAIGIENARLYRQAQQEIAERKQAHEMLEIERASLAQRVAERTAELSTANAELARAARLKDEFLANMSHELRTPLNAILGMSEVLQIETFGSLNDKQRSSLKHIEEGGRHLLLLINDILDLSKIEAGKLELNLDTVPIEDVCQSSLRFVQQQALKKQIKLVSDFDASVKTLEVDERRLKQILVNLLTNAVKFTPSGGQVGLEVIRVADESAVRFTVWDTGVGISEEDLQRLFRPFVQLDSSLAREHEGTGLGLVLVYRLAELHGGSVAVESQVGQGSRFMVSIPWRSIGVFRGKTGLSQAETPVPTGVSEATDLPRPLILLAEDNQANITLIHDLLQAHDYQVIVARNGYEAVERARDANPALILMDIQMPGMDGLEAIRRIRADTEPTMAQIPIIALTALAMAGDKERCLEAGANAYLSKPTSMRQLLDLIEEFLARESNKEQTNE